MAVRDFLILDSHPVARAGLRAILGEFTAAGSFREADTVASAWLALERARPDLIVMDINLNGPSGLDFIRDLSAHFPHLPVVVFSSSPESRFAERVLRAGGQAYVMKCAPPSVLVEAVRRVLAGGVFVSQAVSDGILARLSPASTPQADKMSGLSDREFEVFVLIGDGVGTSDIARRLRVSISTVETYRGAIKRKLGFATGNELVRAAVAYACDAESGQRPEPGPVTHEGGSCQTLGANRGVPDFLQT